MLGLITGALGLGASLLGNDKKNDAIREAGQTQFDAAQLGVDEQRRQFDAIREMMSGFVSGGQDAFSQMIALTGGAGDEAYQEQIDMIQNGPEFNALVENGEEAILANASATGGLRGGNTQGALAQFRPEMLRQSINQRYSQLGGLANMGQSSAAMTANAGMQTGQGISGLIQQGGAAQAGATLAAGRNNASMINDAAALFTGGLRGAF